VTTTTICFVFQKTLADPTSGERKWVSKSLAPICEHGVLFEVDISEKVLNKKKYKLRKLCYWVVGRLYSGDRETYLCYQDGPLSQNIIECAFKISQTTTHQL
jgi:hypothetical protein